MNFEKEMKRRKTNIQAGSIQSDIPYATLYPIIKGRVEIGTCTYFTVAKLARFLGYRPDEIVYEKEDFQTFRNNTITESKEMSWNVLMSSLDSIFMKEICMMQSKEKIMYSHRILLTGHRKAST